MNYLVTQLAMKNVKYRGLASIKIRQQALSENEMALRFHDMTHAGDTN